jgi:hypothetical protein
MKALTLALLLPATAGADVLTNLSPFLSSSAPDFTPQRALHDPAPTPFSPGDSDLGVQHVLGSYRGLPPVDFAFELSGNFTDNAPGDLNDPGGSAFFLAAQLAADWRPRLAGGWFADLGVSQEVLRFEGRDSADFENFQPHIGVAKSFADLDDLVFFARYEYQRLTSGSWEARDYAAQRLRGGLQKALLVTPRQQLSASLDAAFDLSARPLLLEHNTYSAELNYTWWMSDRLAATVSWCASKWDFSNDSREDSRHIAGLELSWRLAADTRLSTNIFYTNHNSNTPSGANDRQAWQTGLGLGFNHTF